MPTSCACGAAFSVEHALSCPKGGFPSIRHNEIRDYLLSEICHNVSTEPHLQPITGEVPTSASANFQDGARLDVAADGFADQTLYSSAPASYESAIFVLLYIHLGCNVESVFHKAEW